MVWVLLKKKNQKQKKQNGAFRLGFQILRV